LKKILGNVQKKLAHCGPIGEHGALVLKLVEVASEFEVEHAQ
jgi:hypothetical protein